jgi:hypothetical protein
MDEGAPGDGAWLWVGSGERKVRSEGERECVGSGGWIGSDSVFESSVVMIVGRTGLLSMLPRYSRVQT